MPRLKIIVLQIINRNYSLISTLMFEDINSPNYSGLNQAFAHPLPLNTHALNQGFATSALLTFGARPFFLVHYGIFDSIPSL